MTRRVGRPIVPRTVLLAAVALTLAACGGGDEPAATADPASTTPPEQTTTTVAPFGPLEELPVVEIDATDLPAAPPGFVDADVAALAEQITTIAQRGLEETVWTASPDAALEHVLGALPTETVGSFKAVLAETYARPTSWVVADAFDPEDLPIGPPRILARQWTVEVVPAADGTPAVNVALRLSLAYAFEPDPGFRVALVQRSVRLGSIAPRDPAALPGLGATTRADGIVRCDLVLDGLLRPAEEQADNIEYFLDTLDPATPGWGKARDGSPEATDTTDC